MTTTLRAFLPSLLVCTALAPSAVWSADRVDLGLRARLMLGDGVPANDIPGFGLFGRYRWSDRWALGFAVDRTEYDFERPAELLGLAQSTAVEPVDSLAEATTFGAWIERTYRRSKGEWFLGLGLGAASVDVPDASGPLQGSGRFDIRTEVDTELLVSLLAGWQRSLGSRFFVRTTLRVDQHFARWRLTDRVSGRTGAIDDYLTYGGDIGLGFTF